MTDPVNHGSRRRRVRLFVLIGVLVLLVAYTGCDLWAGRKVEAAVASIEGRYGKLSTGSMATPSVPAAENRARLVRAAAALTVPWPADARNVIGGFGGPNEPARVPDEGRRFVDANRRAIELAAEFGSRERSNWEIDYAGMGDVPPLVDIRTLSNALYFSALLDLQSGKPEEAVKSVVSGMAMSASLRQEPIIIVQLIRIAVANRQFDVIQRLMTRADLSRVALADLARVLEENREPEPLRIGLFGEAEQVHLTFSALEKGRAQGAAPLGPSIWRAPFARLGRPFVRMAHARYLEHLARLLDLQTGPRPRPQSPDDPRASWWSPVSRLVVTFTSGLERAIETGDDYGSEFAAARVAVALRRYKLDHHVYPDDLSALAPAYLPQVPIDPHTGKPPTYTRHGDGFKMHVERGDTYVRQMRPTLDWIVAK